MVTTVFFDLNGTLLPMDQNKFLDTYTGSLTKKMAHYGYDPELFLKAFWAGTGAMVRNDGSRVNAAVLWNTFSSVIGKDALADEPVVLDYYQNEFQSVSDVCGFNPAAAEAVRETKALGKRIVLATNPLFLLPAIVSRVRWAGVNPEDFEYITSYENSSWSKPNPGYFREIMDKLGVQPEECLMIGNDVKEDMAARTLGIRVFLLTDCLINRNGDDISQYPHGSFPELLAYLRSL